MTRTRPLPPALLLRCGCEVPLVETTPICPRHGVTGVARTVRMPPPRIRGVASGPHVRAVDLPPYVGSILPDQEHK